MNLTKLFVIFGVVLITTLGQTEGRRRWLQRTGENIRCAKSGSKILNVTSGAVLDEGHISSVQRSLNCTEIKLNQPKRYKVEPAELKINLNNAKVPRRARINRRMKCSERKRKLNRSRKFRERIAQRGNGQTPKLQGNKDQENKEAPNNNLLNTEGSQSTSILAEPKIINLFD